MTVAREALADHLACQHVEGREQGGGAVSLVVVGHRPGPTLLHRQAGLGSVERLDLRLLVEGEHDGIAWRVHREAHHVDQLVLEVRVVGDLERLDQVGLQSPGLPFPLHRGPREPTVCSHGAVRPVGGIRWRGVAGVVERDTPRVSPMTVLAIPSPAINRPFASRTARCGRETLAAIPSSPERSFLVSGSGGAGGRAIRRPYHYRASIYVSLH